MLQTDTHENPGCFPLNFDQGSMTMNKNNKPEGVFDKLWAMFASVRLCVVVLLLLAATSVIGTLIPQNQAPAYYFNNYGDLWFRAFSTLNVFDMYHSWWFQFLILLLAMNIMICSIDRLPRVLKIVKRKPSFDEGRFRKAKNRQVFEMDGNANALKDAFGRTIRKKFGRVAVEDQGEGLVFFSEKGRASRLGVYVVHASVLLLLFGGLLGSIWGLEGTMMIPEGEQSDHVLIKNSDQSVHLPFAIRCNKFELTRYDNGAPKEYKSDLTIIENDQDVLSRSIIVNDPMRYQGINVFQASYGVIAGDKATLAFTSRGTNMIYKRDVAMGKPEVLPENLGTFTLTNHMSNYPFMGHDIGECFVGTLENQDGQVENIVLPIRFNGFDKMRKGAVSVSVEDYEKKFYTGLQITRDPGVWLVYAGFILMIAGCYIAFFMSHQVICVKLEQAKKNTCRVSVAGSANKNKMGLALEIKKMASLLKDAGSH
jgi:cytochrome c biogenesis protein